MKKTIFIATIVLASLAITSCGKDQTNQQEQQSTTANQKTADIRSYSACVFWLITEPGIGDTCVNYYYINDYPYPDICYVRISDSGDCGLFANVDMAVSLDDDLEPLEDDLEPLEVDLEPGMQNGTGSGSQYSINSLIIYDYSTLRTSLKAYFDNALLNGEIAINDGFIIDSEELYEYLGTYFVEGGSFPVSLKDDKLIIDLK